MIDQPSNWSLGIDGGGTKTLAIIVDAAGNEQARARAGSANHQDVGVDTALLHISQAIEAAVLQAGCTLPVDSAWFGLAGLDHPSDHALLTPLLQSFARKLHLTNDAELVLSVLPGTTGVALIAGTGSIALGQDAHGASARAGGWGHLIGDEGSGYDLGRQCLQAMAQATDGRAQTTMLTNLVLQHWHLGAASDIINKVYNNCDKATIAALSPLVCSAARDGDKIACRIIATAARSLATAVVAVKNHLDFPKQPLNLARSAEDSCYTNPIFVNTSLQPSASRFSLATFCWLKNQHSVEHAALSNFIPPPGRSRFIVLTRHLRRSRQVTMNPDTTVGAQLIGPPDNSLSGTGR